MLTQFDRRLTSWNHVNGLFFNLTDLLMRLKFKKSCIEEKCGGKKQRKSKRKEKMKENK